jgi:O-antigen ligase
MPTVLNHHLPGFPTPLPESTPAARVPLAVPIALLVWWTFHLANFFFSQTTPYGALEATANGSLVSQLQVVFLALIGLPVLPLAIDRLIRSGYKWPYWLAAYLTWSGLTICWSASPDLGIRRFGALLLICVGAIAIGGGFYGRTEDGASQLLRHLRVAGLVAVIMCAPSISAEISIEHLLDPAWATSVRDLGSETSFAVAYALIASLLPMNAGTRLFHKVGTLALLVLLILLKSRSLIPFTLLVVLITYLCLGRRTAISVGLMFVSAATFLLFSVITYYTTPDLPNRLLLFFARGDSYQTITELNGRTPLWAYVWNDVGAHFWVGVGFGSYWTPARLIALWNAINWQAPFAHNGYLEELLQTGAIGLGLFITFCLTAIKDLLQRRPRGSAAEYIVFGWLLLFLLINIVDSLLQQSYLRVPFMFTLAGLAACSTASPSGRRAIREQKPEEAIAAA